MEFKRYVLLFCVLAFCGRPLSAQDVPAGGLKLSTVVIDPGHGGKDAGCVSKDRKVYEKNITLAVSKLLGQKIKDAYPDVKVIYTRSTDKYVTLNGRAEIANSNHANLFLSIHVNSVDLTSPHGYSTHILGQSSDKNRDLFSYNMDVCRRENSVILLEEDYTAKYQGFDPNDPESFIFFNLMQNAFYEQSLLFATEINSQLSKGPITHSRGISQDPFYVLWKTTMPAVLVEIGFLSNSSDLKILNSDSGKEAIAQRLFLAFKSFKMKYDGSLRYETVGKTDAAASTGSGQDAGPAYGTQIFVLSRKLGESDSSFKGYDVKAYRSGDVWKYVAGAASSEPEAREKYKSIKKDFPDSYMVEITDGNVVPLK